MHIEKISAEKMLLSALQTPITKINRRKFLYKELKSYYKDNIVEKALTYNPAYAGISSDKIDNIADGIISYETNKVTAVSFATGLPGGLAMFASIPADITQYFVFLLRVMQKLAYLYGFEDFNLSEDDISDSTLNQLLIFLGVMFGVQGTNAAIKTIAQTTSNNIAKN